MFAGQRGLQHHCRHRKQQGAGTQTLTLTLPRRPPEGGAALGARDRGLWGPGRSPARDLSLPQCYMFHMYVGVRAGGGIGDEIEDPAGDEYEIYRIIFDITFFFFVIVILLAIIQGNGSSRSSWP